MRFLMLTDDGCQSTVEPSAHKQAYRPVNRQSFAVLSPQMRSPLILTVTLLYLSIFLFTGDDPSLKINTLLILPTVVAGWRFGLRLGLLIGLLAALLFLLLF